jgi:ketosteroid isomerase-like protein
MQRSFLGLMFIVALALAGVGQTRESRNDEVQQILATFDQSIVKRDEATGRRLLHDDFTFVNPSGMVLDRERFVKLAFGGSNVYEEHQTEDVSIRSSGDVAVCRGLLKFRVSVNGQMRDLQSRITVVIVKEKGQWQLFTYHASAIPPPRPPQQPPQPLPAPTKPPSEL